MKQNHKLSKAISDASWGKLLRFIEYKAEWEDKEMIRVGQFFSSSKLCSNCGWKNEDLTLDDRKWTCGRCGVHHNRDENAATNIENEGIKILSGCGAQSDVKEKRGEALPLGESMTPEAQRL